MTREDEQKFQQLLLKKQSFVQQCIRELQQKNKDKAVKLINIDSGINIEIVKLIEKEK